MSNTDSETQPPVITEQRRELVNQAIQIWVSRLIDFSRRNNLLYYRELKNGTIDVSNAEPEALTYLLQGSAVLLSRFLRSDESLNMARLQVIRRKALANLEEKGLNTLFLSVGLASWTPSDDGRPAQAPVLLVPLVFENRGREGRSVAIKRNGDLQANLALLHFLHDQFKISVTPESLIAVLQGDNEGETYDPTQTFDLLAQYAAGIPGFSIAPKLSISNFSFQKMALVRDLLDLERDLPTHDVVAAMSGDSEARRIIRSSFSDVDLRELDAVPADAEHLVLDADSSQQRVIAIVEKGQHCIVHGPPGTGKSQTIANLIASLAAKGKRVLFVAEKRAALRVVLERLERIGLGHLALDLHGADLTRSEILKKIAQSLDQLRASVPVDMKLHPQFEDRRKRLNFHDARMHEASTPAELTLFEIQSKLLGLGPRAKSTTRWRGANLERLTPETGSEIRNMLVELGGLESLFGRTDPSPWTGAALRDGKAARDAIDTTNLLSATLVPNAARELLALESVCRAEGRMFPGESLERVSAFVDLLDRMSETRRKFNERVFQAELGMLGRWLQPAARGGLSQFIAWCTSERYRAAVATCRELRRDRNVSVAKLAAEIRQVQKQMEEWAEFSREAPLVADASAAKRALDAMNASLKQLEQHVPALKETLHSPAIPGDAASPDGSGMLLAKLQSLVDRLAKDSTTAVKIPRLLEIEERLEGWGLAPFLDEIRNSERDARTWPVMFEYGWLSSILNQRLEKDPELAAFNGRTHDRFVEDFKTLDRQRIELARQRVRRSHAVRVIRVMNEYANQTLMIRREAGKKRRHLPLRRLVTEAPNVLTALCPCWMASPLSVSQLLPANASCFDFVIFDEASQILPEDAIPAIYRGTHLVVAGDPHQLPPTTFFAVTDDVDEVSENAAATEGFESLLDVASTFVQSAPLDWHYRSRDERLISFSNRHIYGDRLVTFPGPGGPACVSHVLVTSGDLHNGPENPGEDRDEESRPSEVAKVVELVLAHAKNHPDETLGVIAMGITHASCVQSALDQVLAERPELDEFFDQSKPERFFVKNLERVQGDERDAIILTIGYGKDRDGKLLFRFGPLLQAGGERRLNVAVTRARKRMTIVSSFSHLDMDPQKIRNQGVELLRAYLEYAADGRSGDATTKTLPLNGLESDVIQALAERGMQLLPQVGASKYRIDLVAQDPANPGKFVLAIECDGPTYHASPTARDRDRLRQQHLEALGWKFHRIWSTDWFQQRDTEIQRAVDAFELAHQFHPEAERKIVPTRAMSRMTRSPRPSIPSHENIEGYTQADIARMIRWIQSDGKLRTHEELMAELREVLGFKRRGSRIDDILGKSIRSLQ